MGGELYTPTPITSLSAGPEALEQYGEVNLFLRGIIPMLGFKTALWNMRAERFAARANIPSKKCRNCRGRNHLSHAPPLGHYFSGHRHTGG
jgi:hypothetical protein